jgi:hypothetical protein
MDSQKVKDVKTANSGDRKEDTIIQDFVSLRKGNSEFSHPFLTQIIQNSRDNIIFYHIRIGKVKIKLNSLIDITPKFSEYRNSKTNDRIISLCGKKEESTLFLRFCSDEVYEKWLLTLYQVLGDAILFESFTEPAHLKDLSCINQILFRCDQLGYSNNEPFSSSNNYNHNPYYMHLLDMREAILKLISFNENVHSFHGQIPTDTIHDLQNLTKFQPHLLNCNEYQKFLDVALDILNNTKNDDEWEDLKHDLSNNYLNLTLSTSKLPDNSSFFG